MHVTIIGGGIGGLAAGVALHRRGIGFTVYERDPAFEGRRQGYGLTLSTPKALEELGILDEILQIDTASEEHFTFAPDGAVTGYFGNLLRGGPTSEQRGNLRVPRETLRRLLLDRIPAGSVRWGHKLLALEAAAGGDGVVLRFSTGDGSVVEERATVAVGADGIHSRVRAALAAAAAGGAGAAASLPDASASALPRPLPSARALHYLGVVAVLGISTLVHPLILRRGFYTLDGRQRLFTMPFRDGAPAEGEEAGVRSGAEAEAKVEGQDAVGCGGGGGWASGVPPRVPTAGMQTMWQLSFACEDEAEASRLRGCSSDELVAEALRRTAGWHEPVQALLSATVPGEAWATGLYDHGEGEGEAAVVPGKAPGSGRELSPLHAHVTLLGDSAHPMSPFKGQGANQALRDGPLLASCLARASTPRAALVCYEREMAQRAGAKVLASREAAIALHGLGSPTAGAAGCAGGGAAACGAGGGMEASGCPHSSAGVVAGVPDDAVPAVLALARERGVNASCGASLNQRFREVAREVLAAREKAPGAAAGGGAPAALHAAHCGPPGTAAPIPARWTLLYYCYRPLPGALRGDVAAFLRAVAAELGIKGRIRVGEDGINAAIGAESRAALEEHARRVSAHPLFADQPPIDFKYAPSAGARSDEAVEGSCFSTFVAKEVREIVTLNLPRGRADPANTGVHLPPEDFHRALLEAGERAQRRAAAAGPAAVPAAPEAAAGEADAEAEKEVVLIDVRNGYETAIGTFDPPPGVALLLPPTRTFAEMDAWYAAHEERLRGRKILMCCTGGVRCIRASALLKERGPGFEDVSQLSGGIQRYMEAAEADRLPGGGSLWKGKLFVFDERPAVRVAGALEGAPEVAQPPTEEAAARRAAVLGRCLLCAAPWDTYNWLRCKRCGVLVLCCDACVDAAGGAAAVAPLLECVACADPAAAEAAGLAIPRPPRKDPMARRAERKQRASELYRHLPEAAAGAGGGAASVEPDDLPELGEGVSAVDAVLQADE